LVGSLVVLVAAVGLPAGASAAEDHPPYCDVEYVTTPLGPGKAVTATLAVTCDDISEIQAVEQTISMRDLSANRSARTCAQTAPREGGTLACDLGGVKFHSYLVVYHVTAVGSFAACIDTGECDAGYLPLQGSCTYGPENILDCTYRDVVTVLP
jgi:hypothetical protein